MITIFKNFNEVIEHKTIPEILHEIKTGKFRPGITYLRKSLAENKMEAYEKAKKSLPAFTPSGKFVGGRKMEFLEAYSNFIILDIDKLSQTDLQNAKHIANQCEYTYASFISPSGNGLKILVKVDIKKEDHKETFLAIQKHYENLLNQEIDKSGKDITRLCFYSFDDNLYHNEASKVFVTSSEVEMSLSGTASNQSSQAEPVEASQLPTATVTATNSEAVYNHCVRFTEKKVQYATGSRNVFVHQLACNLNRKGISLNEALSFILTDFGYDEKEVTQTVHSAYGNIHEFAKDSHPLEGWPKVWVAKNKSKETSSNSLSSGEGWGEADDEDKPKPTQIDRLELFLSTRFQFRHNVVSGKLEYKINKGFSFSSLSGRSGGGLACNE